MEFLVEFEVNVPAGSDRLPEPRLTLVYRLEATLGQALDIGETAQGHRRIVPLTGGAFTGGRQAAGVIYETYLVA
jgi:hypothetical protein